MNFTSSRCYLNDSAPGFTAWRLKPGAVSLTHNTMTKDQAKKFLKKELHIKPSDKLVTFQKSVSQSGMSRRIEVYVLKNNELVYITKAVASLIDWNCNDNGLLVAGCGMDMHFHTVDVISSELFNRKRVKTFRGNGGGCMDWKAIY